MGAARNARPRFSGHRQPRIPRDGYNVESSPTEAARQIDLASANGVDGFLIDYYWYDDGGYLEGALDNGLLEAPNIDDISFALMWANHNMVNIFSVSRQVTQCTRR